MNNRHKNHIMKRKLIYPNIMWISFAVLQLFVSQAACGIEKKVKERATTPRTAGNRPTETAIAGKYYRDLYSDTLGCLRCTGAGNAHAARGRTG